MKIKNISHSKPNHETEVNLRMGKKLKGYTEIIITKLILTEEIVSGTSHRGWDVS